MKRLDQQGAAAILSVVIFSIIITVVVTAYLRIAISGQAEAMNFDLSTRAYYAAESGIQDALRSISSKPDSKEDCSPFVPSGSGGMLDAEGFLAYTCQLIDVTPSSIEFPVGQDSNGMARLLPAVMASPIIQYDLLIRWYPKQEAMVSGLRARESGSSAFTTQQNWKTSEGDTIYPALRASIISYPVNSTITQNNLKQSVYFLNPVDTTTSTNLGDVSLDRNASSGHEQVVQNARCSNDTNATFDGYMCEQRIRLSNFDLNNIALYARLHSLYGSTDVQLSLTPQGSNNKLPLKGSVVQIDVTGKAGNTFKRVRQTFNLNNGVILDNLPEAAVIGGDGICKHYTITDQAEEFDPGECFN